MNGKAVRSAALSQLSMFIHMHSSHLFSARGSGRQAGNAPGARQPWGRILTSFLASGLLVAVTTASLLTLQRFVMAQEPHTYIRPYIGLYILPVILMTWLGGRFSGFVTLFLSTLTSLYFLLPPTGWQVVHRSDWVGLITFIIMSGFLTLAFDALQTKAHLIAVATETRQENTRLSLETQEAQSRLQTVLEVAHDQRLAKMLPPLLLPELPAEIAGLDLRVHYEALIDADSRRAPFFDCFSVNDDTVALVVGGLDGSGLAAPTGVASVRHMLRSALYRGASPAEAARELNAILSAHHLLPSPCRLLIGLYSATSQTWVATACGPVLAVVRRAADGRTEDLAAPAPLLGVHGNAVFGQQTRQLFPGDSLLLFEADDLNSPRIACWKETWKEQMSQSPPQDASQLVHQLVHSCRKNPGQRGTDDVCLIVAVVQAGKGPLA
jgi:serine phosphatase RsbU (regulator of sigma subunit)